MVGVSVMSIGVMGVSINSKSLVRILMSLELILVGVMLIWFMESLRLDDIVGELYGLMILGIAGGESAIGLGIAMSFYSLRQSIVLGNKAQG